MRICLLNDDWAYKGLMPLFTYDVGLSVSFVQNKFHPNTYVYSIFVRRNGIPTIYDVLDEKLFFLSVIKYGIEFKTLNSDAN